MHAGPGAPELPPTPPTHPHHYRWAELTRRAFELDVLHCQHCGGRRKLIAMITDAFVARRILEHLGLPSELSPIAPARAPPRERCASDVRPGAAWGDAASPDRNGGGGRPPRSRLAAASGRARGSERQGGCHAAGARPLAPPILYTLRHTAVARSSRVLESVLAERLHRGVPLRSLQHQPLEDSREVDTNPGSPP